MNRFKPLKIANRAGSSGSKSMQKNNQNSLEEKPIDQSLSQEESLADRNIAT